MYKYVVIVDDNFHHMENGERYKLGEFDTCEAAIAACKKVVDEFLLPVYEPHHTQEVLWKLYTAFGDDAYIVTEDPTCRFSGWNYAKERCKELAESNGQAER